jgi:hypothetical protein
VGVRFGGDIALVSPPKAPGALNLVVRCRTGHLFTTIWIPGASLKAVRFGWWRLQHCPVGKHWSIVAPVKETELSNGEKLAARGHKDVRLP